MRKKLPSFGLQHNRKSQSVAKNRKYIDHDRTLPLVTMATVTVETRQVNVTHISAQNVGGYEIYVSYNEGARIESEDTECYLYATVGSSKQ